MNRPLTLVLAAMGLATACRQAPPSRRHDQAATFSSDQSTGNGSEPPPSADGATPTPSVVALAVSGFNAHLRVKTLPQIRSALDACVGPGRTTIDAAMLLPADGTLPPVDEASGRFAFLDSERYAAGDDVLAKEGSFLLDPARSERFGADADQMSAPYLRAIETVANVVAHNCPREALLCDCRTAANAAAMMRRCLPALAPDTAAFTDATTSLAARCADGPSGFRTALASLLASYAFLAKN